jgi:hypothetical protein
MPEAPVEALVGDVKRNTPAGLAVAVVWNPATGDWPDEASHRKVTENVRGLPAL